MHKGWLGVDLDGTLAQYDGRWKGPEQIGEPIELMANRVKQWLVEGVDVRIFTARVYWDGNEPTYKAHLEAKKHVEEWSHKVFGVTLPVTCTKDFSMVQLYDDRAVQVMLNAGTTRDEHMLNWFQTKLRAYGLEIKQGEGDLVIVPIQIEAPPAAPEVVEEVVNLKELEDAIKEG